jgi:demethylmenaquinone methyltransferase / 2-methoxy-6-polyprenyl-1,4-benzoquinol methylase
MPDPTAVKSMFGRIARRYDLANRVLSLGIDTHWRKRFVEVVRQGRPGRILDLATGSGDVALALAKGLPEATLVLGMDFSEPMLEEARAKLLRHPDPQSRVQFQFGDGLALPLPDQSFDAVTIAFGLRNMADRPLCLDEILRVLKPGGRLHVLEFSQPQAWLRPLYTFQIRYVAPWLAALLTGDRSAYEYLATSIGAFPGLEGLSYEIEAAGFSQVTGQAMTFGIVALHCGVRPALVS